MNKGFLKKLVVFIFIIGIPVAAYFFIKSAEDNFYRLPILGPRAYDEAIQDTAYHTIPDFELTAHTGETISKEDLEGKIHVANFFFTTCLGICPRMTHQMTRVQDSIQGMEDVMILSYSVDPEKDTIEALQAYADKYNIDENKWLLLHGEREEVYPLAHKGYFLPVQEAPENAEEAFVHSERFILVDKENRIRGYYSGVDSSEVDNLIKDINILRFEYQWKKEQEQ